MYTVLIVFHVLLAAALIAVVLIQRGPGATMGAAFGSGASGTVFGSRGAAGFLTRLTSWLGVGFFAISLSMAVMVARSGGVGQQSPDDLGVAGQIAPLPTEEEIESGEADQFLTEPADEDETAGEDAEVFPEPAVEDDEAREEDEEFPEPPAG
ncbi:MAG: preprotein translocase subunit SecG [Wenzhouxiangella sp.]